MRTHLLIAGALLILALYMTHERILFFAGDLLVVRDELRPSDVIHVVAGEDYRTDYAIQLFQQGYGKMLFFTGGWCSLHHSFHGQRSRERALAQGIPSEAIAVDASQVSSTYSEAVRLGEFLKKKGTSVRTVMVVSDPHHMRRAKWAYRKALGEDVKIAAAAVPFESSQFQRRWWEDEGSRRMVRDEYIKILYYYARYQISGGRVKEWLASLDRQ